MATVIGRRRLPPTAISSGNSSRGTRLARRALSRSEHKCHYLATGHLGAFEPRSAKLQELVYRRCAPGDSLDFLRRRGHLLPERRSARWCLGRQGLSSSKRRGAGAVASRLAQNRLPTTAAHGLGRPTQLLTYDLRESNADAAAAKTWSGCLARCGTHVVESGDGSHGLHRCVSICSRKHRHEDDRRSVLRTRNAACCCQRARLRCDRRGSRRQTLPHRS